MILQPASASFQFSQVFSSFCPCNNEAKTFVAFPFSSRRRRKRFVANFGHRKFRRRWSVRLCAIPTDGPNRNWNPELVNSARRGAKGYVLKRISSELEEGNELLQESQSPVQLGSNFTNFQEDPIVDKLRTQLGVIHPIPSPPINRNVVGLFVFFFFVGVVFDKLWTSRRRNSKVSSLDALRGVWPQVREIIACFRSPT